MPLELPLLDVGRREEVWEVLVMRAERLKSGSHIVNGVDTCFTVKWSGGTEFRSETLARKLIPEWNRCVYAPVSEGSFTVSLWDYANSTTGELVGRATIHTDAELALDDPVCRWVELTEDVAPAYMNQPACMSLRIARRVKGREAIQDHIRMEEDVARRTTWTMLVDGAPLLAGLGLLYADLVTNILVMAQFYRAGRRDTFGILLFVMVFPAIILTLFACCYRQRSVRTGIVMGLLQFLMIKPLVDAYRYVRYGQQSVRQGIAINNTIRAIFQGTPQMIIQTYMIINDTKSTTLLQAIAVVLSVAGTGTTMMSLNGANFVRIGARHLDSYILLKIPLFLFYFGDLIIRGAAVMYAIVGLKMFCIAFMIVEFFVCMFNVTYIAYRTWDGAPEKRFRTWPERAAALLLIVANVFVRMENPDELVLYATTRGHGWIITIWRSLVNMGLVLGTVVFGKAPTLFSRVDDINQSKDNRMGVMILGLFLAAQVCVAGILACFLRSRFNRPLAHSIILGRIRELRHVAAERTLSMSFSSLDLLSTSVGSLNANRGSRMVASASFASLDPADEKDEVDLIDASEKASKEVAVIVEEEKPPPQLLSPKSSTKPLKSARTPRSVAPANSKPRQQRSPSAAWAPNKVEPA